MCHFDAFDSFWLNLTQFNSIWFILTCFDAIWHNFTQFNSFWLNLTHFYSFSRNFTRFDIIWCILTHFDFIIQIDLNCCNLTQFYAIRLILTYFYSFWVTLAQIDSFWLILTHFDSFWLILTHSDINSCTHFRTKSTLEYRIIIPGRLFNFENYCFQEVIIYSKIMKLFLNCQFN